MVVLHSPPLLESMYPCPLQGICPMISLKSSSIWKRIQSTDDYSIIELICSLIRVVKSYKTRTRVRSRSPEPQKLCGVCVAINYTSLSMAYYAYGTLSWPSFSLLVFKTLILDSYTYSIYSRADRWWTDKPSGGSWLSITLNGCRQCITGQFR